MRGFCDECGKPIAAKRYIYYCSNACRQKAYRKRKDPQTGSHERQKERVRNGVMTKADTTLKAVCAQCGLEFYRTGTQVLIEYCSNACKQKAYRARKKESSTSWSVGDRVISDTGREGVIKEMRGTTAAIVTETIGTMKLDRYHTLERLRHAPGAPSAPSPVRHEERVAFSLTSKKVTTFVERDPHEVRLAKASKVRINKTDSKWNGHIGRIGPKPKNASVVFEGCMWIYFPDAESPHIPVPFEREFLEVAD